MKNKYTTYFLISQLMIIFIFILTLIHSNEVIDSYFIILILITSIFSYYSLYSALKGIRAYASLKAKNDIIIEQQRIQSEHLLALKSQFKDIEDIKKEISQEHIYSQLKDAQETREYLNQLMKKHITYKTDYCQNRTVDAIIYNKIPIFEKNNIDYTIALIVPSDIPIQIYDLISLFTNLLDNAIAGCQSIDDQRFIELTSNIVSNYFVLKIINSKSPSNKVNLHSPSSKESHHQHGYGLQIINNLAKKYSGRFIISDNSDNVEMSLTLKLEKVDE